VRAPRRHHRHRPLGLSQPGQQRPGLSLHLPRRARRARRDHQRRDEDRRRRCDRGWRARTCPTRSPPPIRPAAALRSRLHHPDAVRSAPDHRRALGGRQGRDGKRRRRKPIVDSTATAQDAALAPRPDGEPDAADHRSRGAANPKRVVFAEGEEEKAIRAALAFRNSGLGTPILIGREERIRRDASRASARPISPEIEIHNARLARTTAPMPSSSTSAAAQRLSAVPRLPAAGQPGPQRLRRLHGGLRPRRRHGDRPDPPLQHRDQGHPSSAS
jgi:hypothetical protein